MISRGNGTATLVFDRPSAGQAADHPSVERPFTIVYGAFKAMGDLLNASPVIASQLNSGHKIKLLLFPVKALREFADLIDFGPNRGNLEILNIPASGGLKALREFCSVASRLDPDLVWISPHAPRVVASWKIPLLLWFSKKRYWRKARIAGASSERFSSLFDVRVPVNRDLPYLEREQLAFSMLSNTQSMSPMRPIAFIPKIRELRKGPPLYDLLIHPGASVPSRMWPYQHYVELARLIPSCYRKVAVGLPQDIEMLRRFLPADAGIEFLTGNLEQAITAIARSRVVLTMDSGSLHFAKALDVPSVALFGKSDPATVISPGGRVLPIYERKFPCQPCGKAGCSQPEAFCINSISPQTVADALLRLLEEPSRPRFLDE